MAGSASCGPIICSWPVRGHPRLSLQARAPDVHSVLVWGGAPARRNCSRVCGRYQHASAKAQCATSDTWRSAAQAVSGACGAQRRRRRRRRNAARLLAARVRHERAAVGVAQEAAAPLAASAARRTHRTRRDKAPAAAHRKTTLRFAGRPFGRTVASDAFFFIALSSVPRHAPTAARDAGAAIGCGAARPRRTPACARAARWCRAEMEWGGQGLTQ